MAIGLGQSEVRKLRKQLRTAFPDAKLDASDPKLPESLAIAAHLTGTSIGVDLAPHAKAIAAEAKKLGLTTQPSLNGHGAEIRVATRASAAFRYYKVAATHDREKPDLGPFTGHLGMVRVRLPDKTSKDFKASALGDVLASDHLMATVAEVAKKYGGIIGPIDRVDLITPARLGNMRFGAISIYLGYRRGEALPSFYVLEAGTATGEPKVLYESTSIDNQLLEFSGYSPTPFSDQKHIYTGRLTLLGDSPSLLRVNAHKDQGSEPYIKLRVVFDETDRPIAVWPGMHLLQAAVIVLARQHAGVKKP
jgi:hypothetical protein